MPDRIRRVWCEVEGWSFEAIFTGQNDTYVLDIPAAEVFSKDKLDNLYNLTLYAQDWATNESKVDHTNKKYGGFLEIQITEAVVYDPIEQDPEPPPMPAWLMDKTYMPIRVIDNFESFIWTERFCDAGDFELYLPMDIDIFNDLKIGYYIGIERSDRLMVIEKIVLSTDAETGHHITVSGRSLESILNRRIVWAEDKVELPEDEEPPEEMPTRKLKVKGSFQDGIQTIITKQFISPKIKNRKIPSFEFLKSEDYRITSLKINRMYLGDNVFDLIKDICYYKDIGFRILPKGKGGFEFSLYAGENRTYEQTANPWIIFSPWYENLKSSSNVQNYEDYKNTAMVKTEYDDPLAPEPAEGERVNEEDNDLYIEVISKDAEKAGLERRELYIDSGIPVQEEIVLEDGEELTDEMVEEDKRNYINIVKNSGLTQIAQSQETDVFSGEIEPVRQFVYGEDFFIGDIVQIENEYGMKKVMRVGEVVRSCDSSGIKISPSFIDLHPPENDEDEVTNESDK